MYFLLSLVKFVILSKINQIFTFLPIWYKDKSNFPSHTKNNNSKIYLLSLLKDCLTYLLFQYIMYI